MDNLNNEKHIPVMPNEVIHYLKIKKDGLYIDCTFGDGGHSKLILDNLNKEGRLISFEWDDSLNNQGKKFLSSNNFVIINDNFSNFDVFLKENGINEVDGFLFDLGISTSQLFDENRGFSYRVDSKLDMRINKKTKINAFDIINSYSYGELSNIFFQFGEENNSKNIAKKICQFRKDKKIETTAELCKIVTSCFKKKKNVKHPAKKVFQSLRIFINNELENLFFTLQKAINFLNKRARIVVITYHSLEDRIVKRFFKRASHEFDNLKLINKKPINPSKNEVLKNNRSRSAKMRIIERI